jgi:hypothetical protein
MYHSLYLGLYPGILADGAAESVTPIARPRRRLKPPYKAEVAYFKGGRSMKSIPLRCALANTFERIAPRCRNFSPRSQSLKAAIDLAIRVGSRTVTDYAEWITWTNELDVKTRLLEGRMSAREGDFSEPTKNLLADRAVMSAASPSCRVRTVGPGATADEAAKVGQASHIYSGAVTGPRGRGSLSADQLADADC